MERIMHTIGVLPASGKASRIGGIPKFCLPVSDERSLLQWHVEQMLEVCDEVRIATRPEWVPIVQNMDMNIKLIVREPSTMSDAIKFMIGEYNDTVLVGMPDTYILNAPGNIYKELFKETTADLVLGIWECTDKLDHPGKQIQDWIDERSNIRAVRPGGRYMDIGTLRGLKQLYKEMDNA